MKKTPPHNYEYLQYLRDVLKDDGQTSSLHIATQDDFSKSEGIPFPYRSDFFAFGLMHQGNCELQVGIENYQIKKKSLTIVGPNIVRNWTINDWKSDNTTIFFKANFFERPFYNNFLLDYEFFKIGAKHVLQLSDEDYRHINSLVEILRANVENVSIASGILFSILESINSLYTDHVTSHKLSRSELLAQSFNQLLNTNFRTQKSVAFYAEQLNVTPKYLSEILKKVTGNTAKQAIERIIVFESQSLLKQTAMDIKEIVFLLGFDDPSHFTKLFKKNTRTTPSEYRESK